MMIVYVAAQMRRSIHSRLRKIQRLIDRSRDQARALLWMLHVSAVRLHFLPGACVFKEERVLALADMSHPIWRAPFGIEESQLAHRVSPSSHSLDSARCAPAPLPPILAMPPGI